MDIEYGIVSSLNVYCLQVCGLKMNILKVHILKVSRLLQPICVGAVPLTCVCLCAFQCDSRATDCCISRVTSARSDL